MTQSSINSL